MESERGPVKPAVKQRLIVDDLRRQIVEGLLPPGAQLPTRTELEQRFGVSSTTLQRALDRLMEDGFVCARGTRGTYVSDAPPHLSRYALVFPHHPFGAQHWPHFWTALANEAARIQRTGQRKMTVYYDIDEHGDSDDHRKLLADVAADRLAGVIFAHRPLELVKTLLLQEPGLPRVAIMGKDDVPGVPAVQLEGKSFYDRVLDYFLGQGRKRLAVLTIPAHRGDPFKYLQLAAQARQMTVRPYWLHHVAPTSGYSVRNLVHLLMHDGQAERPDALFIADDNLVERATSGLVAARVRVPEDVEVVAHANFPWPTPSALPIKRMGYDVRAILQASLDVIDRARRHEPVPSVVHVPAVSEDETPGV